MTKFEIRNSRSGRGTALVAALLSLGWAQDPEPKVKLQFKDVPLPEVIQHVRKVAGFVITDEAGVWGPITAWSEEEARKLMVVLSKLDESPAERRMTQVFRLTNGDAAEVFKRLGELTRGGSGTGAPAGVPFVQACVDARTNSLIVAAAEADLEAMGQTIQRLDAKGSQP